MESTVRDPALITWSPVKAETPVAFTPQPTKLTARMAIRILAGQDFAKLRMAVSIRVLSRGVVSARYSGQGFCPAST